MEELSARQQQILNYIIQNKRQRGYPPSVREIGKGVGLKSSSTVHKHLKRLEETGYIRRDPTKPRAIEVLVYDETQDDTNKELINIPVLGRVTAGEPVLAVENIEDTFPLPINLLRAKNKDLFILRVRGNSMINAGIYSGDYAIVEETSSAIDGDIVVALIEEEATVKRFKKEEDRVLLIPENDSMEPIVTSQVRILGKVIGIFRSLRS